MLAGIYFIGVNMSLSSFDGDHIPRVSAYGRHEGGRYQEYIHFLVCQHVIPESDLDLTFFPISTIVRPTDSNSRQSEILYCNGREWLLHRGIIGPISFEFSTVHDAHVARFTTNRPATTYMSRDIVENLRRNRMTPMDYGYGTDPDVDPEALEIVLEELSNERRGIVMNDYVDPRISYVDHNAYDGVGVTTTFINTPNFYSDSANSIDNNEYTIADNVKEEPDADLVELEELKLENNDLEIENTILRKYLTEEQLKLVDKELYG